jgi:HYR domain
MKHVAFRRDTAEHWRTVANRTGRIKAAMVVVLAALAMAAALLAGIRTSTSATASPPAGMTFFVTNTGDNGGVDPAPGAGTGTLRQAIVDANADAGADTIKFSIPGAGVHTITPNPGLPQIMHPVVIDGYSQDSGTPDPADDAKKNTCDVTANPPCFGDNAVILIEISGAILGNNGDGLVIANGGGGSTIRGLAIDRGFSGGIRIVDSSGNVIEGCFLGTDASGLVAHGNTDGVLIDFGGNSSNNLIGGPTPDARNVISGNSTYGVYIGGGSGTNNMVQGNFIGTDKTGAVTLTSQVGLSIRSNNNLVGGSTPAARNVIAGIGGGNGDGIVIETDSSPPTGNRIQGNFIGTDVTGAIALGFGSGVALRSSSSNTQVGGPTATAGTPPGNVISGNTDGIVVSGAGGGASNNNTIQGNLIGTNAAGTSALGNSQIGIKIFEGAIGELISANGIAFNGALGIDLNGDGVTMNDHCDGDNTGANNLQNYPDLTSASSSGGMTTVTGTLDSIANMTFRVEFFANASCDPSGHGEGQTFLGSTDVPTDGNCSAPINSMVSGNLGGQFITATATRLDTSTMPPTPVETSEFSVCVLVSGSGGCNISCPADQVLSNDPNQCRATVNYPAPTTTGGCGTVTCTPAAGTFFPKGTTTVNCSETGGANCSFAVTVNDTQAPTITCPGNVTTTTAPDQCSATVTYGSASANDNCDGTLSPTCTPASGSSFSKGTTTVTCSATDSSGNTGSCNFTVTVNDNQNPTVTCPTPIITNTASGQCSAAVSYQTPSASDNCPGSTVACSPASGSTFAKGTTTVTCTATDTSGNTGSCQFTVTVNDNQNPTVTCPGNITKSTDSGQCNAVVTYTTPTANDNCPGATVACNPQSGSTFNKGTTTVTCTATDASGNTGSCQFTVTVNDNQSPTVSCPGNITKSTDSGQCNAVVTYTTPTANDNCPSATVACNPQSGSTFNKGTSTVTCTATDTSGNTGSCQFTVTVNDNQAPTVTCPGPIVTNTTAGRCDAVVTYTTPTASDNCPGATVACSPVSGTMFPKGTTTVTCTATDTSGNTGSCQFSVTVNDLEKPSITCPNNITASGTGCVVVNYNNPTISDNCPGVGVPTCNPPSGTCFPPGTTTVNCSVTDASQNSNSCSFTVTVTPCTSITCPADITTTAGAACPFNSGATVSFNPSGSAGCGTITCSPASGSFFPVGTTTVNCASTAGPTCSFTVTVSSFCLQDETNPGNFVLVTATTGGYSFFCNGVQIASGNGTLNSKGCEGTIEHNKGDRRVLISWDMTANGGKGAGTAIVQVGVNNTRCQLTDKDMTNNTCRAAAQIAPPGREREP